MVDEEDMDKELVILDERRGGKKKKAARRTPQTLAKKANEKINGLVCFPEIDKMVRRGVYARKIAEYIQDTAGELKGQSLESVTRAVKRYRASLERAGVTSDVDSGGKIAPDDDDPIYELRVMQEMFNVQRERIDMEVLTEKTLKKLFSTTHDEFEVLNHMGVSILKLKKTLGLVGKEAGRRRRIGGDFSGRLDVAKIAQNPESRHKVLKLTETIMNDPELMEDIVAHGGIEGLEKELAEKKEEEKPKAKKKKKAKKVVKKKKIVRRRKKTTDKK